MTGFALIAVVAGIACFAAWRKDTPRALAFGIVACGLAAMVPIHSQIDGIIAFSIWTLASYMLRNFPVASLLYLLSAFCYILELKGVYLSQIQALSNVLGVLGLAAIWYGRPKWHHRIGFGRGIGGPLAGDAIYRAIGNSEGQGK